MVHVSSGGIAAICIFPRVSITSLHQGRILAFLSRVKGCSSRLCGRGARIVLKVWLILIKRINGGCRIKPKGLLPALILVVAAIEWIVTPVSLQSQTAGPLRVHPTNRRYFTDGSGRAILLAGSHTWASVFEQGPSNPPPPFNITQFENFLQSYGHNFTRTFVWEQSRWATWTTDNNYWFYPGPPWKRTGPGTADDGLPRFNLDSLNQTYFDWVRARVESFNSRGIYCSIQFFDGWSVKSRVGIGNPWQGHPFKSSNNVNGVNGDPNGDNSGEETQAYSPTFWPIQLRYIKKLIDELNGYDNVLWEVSNETSYSGSEIWERRIIDTVHAYENRKPKQHPVGFTGDWYPPILNPTLFASNADWISPGAGSNGEIWKTSPPDSGGRKVVINDTDHLWGNGGDAVWVWMSFCRGTNILYMDGYDGKAYGTGHPWSQADSMSPTVVKLRKNLGYVLDYSRRVNLAGLIPKSALSSTGFCLANTAPGQAEYIVLQPLSGQSFTLDLSATTGTLTVEWFNPSTGVRTAAGTVNGGASRSFTPPFSGEAVLYLTDHPSAVGRSETIPSVPALYQNYPNPFNPTTRIGYDLPLRTGVSLEILSMFGQQIKLLASGVQEPGSHQVDWDGMDRGGKRVASGVYLIRLRTQGHSAVRRVLLLR